MIGLIDCNNFFVSCERVFQPRLNMQPVVVLSSNDGCVIARSQEVKDIGIPMGIAVYKIKDILAQHGVQMRSTNFALYRDMSQRVMNIVKSMTSECEVYSIDEAFFVIPPSENPYIFCQKIRDQVLLCTGIPTSIGVASSKTLAKLSNRQAKRTGKHVHVIETDEDRVKLLRDTSVGEVWGIGRGFSERLADFHIESAATLAATSDDTIKSIFGVNGLQTTYELRGVAINLVDPSYTPRKSIIRSRSFGKKVSCRKELWNSVAYHVATVAQDLRTENQLAYSLRISLQVNRFRGNRAHAGSGEYIFSRPTADTRLMLSAASTLFEDAYVPGGIYAKSGASVSSLVPDSLLKQETLFDIDSSDKESGLDVLVDDLNKKYGTGKVMLATLCAPTHDKSWLPKSHMKSGQFTTLWSDIIEINTQFTQKYQ